MPRGFVSAPLVPPTKPESESEDESDEDELREEAWALGTAAGFFRNCCDGLGQPQTAPLPCNLLLCLRAART